jgi:hypothetical protein
MLYILQERLEHQASYTFPANMPTLRDGVVESLLDNNNNNKVTPGKPWRVVIEVRDPGGLSASYTRTTLLNAKSSPGEPLPHCWAAASLGFRFEASAATDDVPDAVNCMFVEMRAAFGCVSWGRT